MSTTQTNPSQESVNKDKEQRIVWTKWIENNYTGTYIGSTGVGKTKVGVVPIGRNLMADPYATALIIVPTERLRDNEWPSEFKRWGFASILPRVEIVCINTAREFIGRHFTTVVVDEVHTTLSPENIKFYENNSWNRLLTLTATMDDPDKAAYLYRLAPVVWVTSPERALDLGLVAPCKIYNMAVPLSTQEAREYNKANASYHWTENMLGGKYAAFKNAGEILKSTTAVPEAKQAASLFFASMRKRNDITNNAEFKPIVAKAIIEKFSKRKALVFSESIAFADKLQEMLGDICVTFHSKLTPDQKEWAMKKFGDGRTKQRVISSCKALNAGFNVPECSLGICTAAMSKSLVDIQRRGRIVRLKIGKLAIYVNLYSIGTQEEKRLKRRTAGQEVTWITSLNQITELE